MQNTFTRVELETAGMKNQLFISVVVPVFNGQITLKSCLAALKASSYQAYEIIVVDDASTDDSALIAEQTGAQVIKLASRFGPAAARNAGVRRACGDVVFFVDADVVVQPDTIARLAANFQTDAEAAAVFGSYDLEPTATNFVSQYKNLFHHYIHQQAETEAGTFWAGCGAVWRNVFEAVGGFAEEQFSMEDIELGCRLRAAGYRIRLDKSLQVSHLKKWTLVSWLHTDIFQRAVPWSNLIIERQQTIGDLNLRRAHRVSAALVGCLIVVFPLLFFYHQALYLILPILFVLVLLNYRLYKFFFECRGLVFALKSFPLHLCYYFYSGLTFVLCWLRFNLVKRPSGQRAQSTTDL